MLVPVCACGFLIWTSVLRVRHLEYIATAAGTPVEMDSKSATGYAGGVRQFIPGDRDVGSLEPIAQTQQMLARGEWRVRHVDYDSAPGGRPVWSASPYRWWLGAVAFVDHVTSDRPVGAAVERAARVADPLLQLLLLIVTVTLAARFFGPLAAALLSIGIAAMIPLSGAFVAGHPAGDGLAAIVALWSILPLLVVGTEKHDERTVRRHFFAAGMIGGFGLWLDVGGELPVLVGIALGGLFAAWQNRRADQQSKPGPPWRMWALGGAAACLVAYAAEFLPGQDPGLKLDVIHPLHGLAWLGAGELLARAGGWVRGVSKGWQKKEIGMTALAATVLLVPVVIAFLHRKELFATDPSLLRMTPLAGGAIASDLWTWIAREGLSAIVLGTLLPLLVIVPIVWLLVRKSVEVRHRTIAAIALGPVLLTLVVAAFHLRRWVHLDAALLSLLVVGVLWAQTGARRLLNGWLWSGAVVLAAVPGLVALWPAGAIKSVSELEIQSLIERDIAHWLASRAGEGRATVLASPHLSASLAFGGGLRALGSPYNGNRTGLDVSLRIAGTNAQDEAHALVQSYGITHVVLASWDPALEEFSRISGDNEGKSLVALLHRWLPPRWLRPIPYPMPRVSGFEHQTVIVFEVVEIQDNSVALSHLAEFFAEAGHPALARSAAGALGRMFPNDVGALAARVRAAGAAGDSEDARDAFKALETQIAAGGSNSLPWERRVSVAIALAEGRRFDLAQIQMQQCFAELDEAGLRSLTPLTLYRFLALAKGLGMKAGDPKLENLARQLLPPEIRSTL
ncbi:MAG TPA: hypothetical protein VMM36_04160 [Opitutaceae bacterium]|nr:hypothetical protein [Opitutaceae bacterium]